MPDRLPWPSLVVLCDLADFHHAHLAPPEAHWDLQRWGEEPQEILRPMSCNLAPIHFEPWLPWPVKHNIHIYHIFTICLLVPACVLRRNIPSIERALPFSFRWLATNTFLCLWKGASIVKALQRRHPSDDHATTLLRGITTSVAVEPKVSKLFSAFRLTPLLLSRIIFFEYKKYEYNPKVAGEVKKEWGEEWQRNTRRRTEV